MENTQILKNKTNLNAKKNSSLSNSSLLQLYSNEKIIQKAPPRQSLTEVERLQAYVNFITQIDTNYSRNDDELSRRDVIDHDNLPGGGDHNTGRRVTYGGARSDILGRIELMYTQGRGRIYPQLSPTLRTSLVNLGYDFSDS